MKPKEDGMTQSVYETMVTSFMRTYRLNREEAEIKLAEVTLSTYKKEKTDEKGA